MRYEELKVCLDSRLIEKGDYFVPIKGDETDGHLYITNAIKNGAIGIIEENKLYELVQEKLSSINPIIVGVTGSTGKSSVTTFLKQMLETKYRVCLGSLNTKLGLAVNVINDMEKDCEIFIAEMGMDRIGELKETTALFPPNVSVITTINETHAEKLGSIENILKAKTEIIAGTKKEGFAILNIDNKHLAEYGRKCPRKNLWFGLGENANFNPRNINTQKTKVVGNHNICNLMACAATCKVLRMNDEEIENAFEKAEQPKGRLKIIEGINGCTLIDDTYNSSPASTKAALDVLSNYIDKNKIAILGDMLELGPYEQEGHKEIAEYVNGKVDKLVCVGEKANIIFENTKLNNKEWFKNSENFDIQVLDLNQDDIILIKGSQGSRMEKIAEKLMKDPEQAKDLLVRQDARWK